MSTNKLALNAQAQYDNILSASGERTAATSCAYFLDHLSPGMTVLDVGCGEGAIALDLGDCVGETGAVVGVDISGSAIATAQAAAQTRGIANTRFLTANFFSADLPEHSFDIVHAHHFLQHMDDPVGAFKRMAQLCKPGGLVVARDADYGAMAWFPYLAGMNRWREVYVSGAYLAGGEPNAGRHLRAWAHSAGLKVVHSGASAWNFANSEPTWRWGESWAEQALNSSFRKLAESQGCTQAEINEMALAWQDWSVSEGAWFAMPHGEVIARA